MGETFNEKIKPILESYPDCYYIILIERSHELNFMNFNDSFEIKINFEIRVKTKDEERLQSYFINHIFMITSIETY